MNAFWKRFLKTNAVQKTLNPPIVSPSRDEIASRNALFAAGYDQEGLGKFIQECAIKSVDGKFIELCEQVYLRDQSIAMSPREIWNLYSLAIKALDISGDFAELGVYRGGSARVLCSVKKDKSLHLFDTFSGLPRVDVDIENFKVGDLNGGSQTDVEKYLEEFSNLHFYPGFFPETATACKRFRFAFVNLDADTYSSTRDALRFFYPRLTPSGMILVHDYRAIHCPGVKKAVDEFFVDKPEMPIELWDTQAVVVRH